MTAATLITLVSLVPPYLAGYLIDRVVRPAQLGREAQGLVQVAPDDLVVEMFKRAHVRGPCVVRNRTALQVLRSTRKAGSRRENDPMDF